ncbi:MAG: STAS domain-containing protein [Planctomycetes bacterium]|nr:STAS domain-containing protein [Planctomycetota bacterium]
MLDDLEVLRVLEPGERTVVSLGDVEFPDEVVLERCRADLDRLLADGHVRTLAFDLDGVVIIPSTMLGLLLTVRGRGVQVELINPSPDVREVLRITRLESRFRVLPDGR